MFDSFWPHGLQHARLPCPSLSLNYDQTMSLIKFMSIESVMLFNHLILCRTFTFCPQSFPASESFPISQLFILGGQSSGTSALASVLPMNIQGLIPSRIDWLDLLAVQGTLKNLLQHRNSKASILWCSAFFMVQLSSYTPTEKPLYWLSRPLSAKWCLCFLICCLGLS